jgi:two-component system nitrogen regulation response regulator NtrX
MNARILVVDDEPDIRFLLKDILEDEGYLVDVAEHARAANEIRRKVKPDLVLLDIWMPEVDGVTLLKEWKSSGRDDCPVVMMSGHGTVETAVEATRFGAVDFVEKPLSMAKLLNTVKSALAGRASGARGGSPRAREEPVGNSQIMQQLRRRMVNLQQSSVPVFILGKKGSGKAIWGHYLSDTVGGMQTADIVRGLDELVPLNSNCYIEEICDLDLNQQRQLFQIISEQADSKYRFIISSQHTSDDLMQNNRIAMEFNDLCRDAIRIPSLDEHIEDIPEMLEYYVNWFSDHEQLPYRHFDVAAQNLLRNYRWNGDIGQLKQFIRKILANNDDEKIELFEIEQTLLLLSASSTSESGNKIQIAIDLDLDLREAREAFEREYLSRHLALSGNNMTELARRVGQERTHLYRKLKSLGLQTKK